MRIEDIIKGMIILAAIVLFLISSTGCVNVNASADGYGGYGLHKANEAMAAHDAKNDAKKAVREQNINPDYYDLKAVQQDKTWWVTFQIKKDANVRDLPSSFAVRVFADGKTRIYWDNGR